MYGIIVLDPSIILTVFLGFFLTCIPYIIERRVGVTLPWEANFLIAFSVFLHVAGYSHYLYAALYPYYDKFAHFISSITVAILAFVSILLIYRFSCTKLHRWQIFFYIVIIFTMAIGAFWEIYEYLVDLFFESFLIKPLQHGLDDTMIDLIMDLLGESSWPLWGHGISRIRHSKNLPRTWSGNRSLVANSETLSDLGFPAKKGKLIKSGIIFHIQIPGWSYD
jgi:hypothetical protein